MLAKRIIPCLDVKDGRVVKGVRFRDHEIIGDIVELARKYRGQGADELVFYDITASSDGRMVDINWIERVADVIDIPFCVAGGIRSIKDAKTILSRGADKISINSPALESPDIINHMADEFGSQCVVVGVDSYAKDGEYRVYQYTGDPSKTKSTYRKTLDWIGEAVARGAGEIVLNCMNEDGTRQGYDIQQLIKARERINVPLIASGGAGQLHHFLEVFEKSNVDGALAASVFHKDMLSVGSIKDFLKLHNIQIRPS